MTDNKHSDIERVAFMSYIGCKHHELMDEFKKVGRDAYCPEEYKELLHDFMVCYKAITVIEHKYLEVLNGRVN